jgi:hypothetical protein
MTSELITPGDEHREEIVGLMRVAFNLGSAGLAERAAWLPVEKMRAYSRATASSRRPRRATSVSGSAGGSWG